MQNTRINANTPQSLAMLLLAVVLSYANIWRGGFQFDDFKVIVDNPAVQSWGAWWDTEGQGLLGLRPLLKMSYVLNWESGWGLAGFHLTNWCIHLACTLVVYFLAKAWLNAQGTLAVSLDNRSLIPLFSAMFFALHPANTEAVTYICGRSTSLMALPYLAGVLLYASAQKSIAPLRRYVGVPLLFCIALGVKETAVTFPFALLLWELVCGTKARQIWQRQWPVWLLLGGSALYFLSNASHVAEMQRSVQLNHLAGNLATQAKALTYLLRQWGLPLWLNIDPDLSLLYNLTDAPAFLAVLVCALAGSVWCWRTRPWLGFAIAWALVHLVMLYVLLPRLDIANDRQLYLACWPLGMVLVVEVSRWKWPANKAVVLTMLALCLGGLTFLRNDNYRDEISLWETTLPLSVGKARAHSNLGYAYQLAGRANDARREYQAALQIDPQHIKARYNLQRLAMPVPE